MTTISLVHNGRQLEVRASVIAGDWQLWVYEAGNRIYLHSIVPFEQAQAIDALDRALREAQKDIESEAIVVPVVRSWRPGQQPPTDTSGCLSKNSQSTTAA
jgi:hypothetical protein